MFNTFDSEKIKNSRVLSNNNVTSLNLEQLNSKLNRLMRVIGENITETGVNELGGSNELLTKKSNLIQSNKLLEKITTPTSPTI